MSLLTQQHNLKSSSVILLFVSTTSLILLISSVNTPVDAQYMNGMNNMASTICPDGGYRDMIPSSYCVYNMDCNQRYSYSECDWYGMGAGMGGYGPIGGGSQKSCFCRCGYRWDITSMTCISNSCWFCSSGVMVAIVIVILVIVIIVACFTIPTCALVSCMGNKQ